MCRRATRIGKGSASHAAPARSYGRCQGCRPEGLGDATQLRQRLQGGCLRCGCWCCPRQGTADTGDLAADLPELMIAVETEHSPCRCSTSSYGARCLTCYARKHNRNRAISGSLCAAIATGMTLGPPPRPPTGSSRFGDLNQGDTDEAPRSALSPGVCFTASKLALVIRSVKSPCRCRVDAVGQWANAVHAPRSRARTGPATSWCSNSFALTAARSASSAMCLPR